MRSQFLNTLARPLPYESFSWYGSSICIGSCEALDIPRRTLLNGNNLLTLQVVAAADEDDEELVDLNRRLRNALLELDVESVTQLANSAQPDGGKGVGAAIGWLAVQVGAVESLRSAIATVVSWATRAGRTVEVTYGEDRLTVKGVTSAQQERIIESFLSRHAPGT